MRRFPTPPRPDGDPLRISSCELIRALKTAYPSCDTYNPTLGRTFWEEFFEPKGGRQVGTRKCLITPEEHAASKHGYGMPTRGPIFEFRARYSDELFAFLDEHGQR